MDKKKRLTQSKKSSRQVRSTPSLSLQLEQVVRELNIIQAAVICAGEVIHHQASGYDSEAALLLRRCASDGIHTQIEVLEGMIAQCR